MLTTQTTLLIPKKSDTYLTEKNILFLKRMFSDEEAYRYYMKTLWLLRRLAGEACQVETPAGLIHDTKSDLWPILKTINELIGCLHQNDTHFDINGNMIKSN